MLPPIQNENKDGPLSGKANVVLRKISPALDFYTVLSIILAIFFGPHPLFYLLEISHHMPIWLHDH